MRVRPVLGEVAEQQVDLLVRVTARPGVGRVPDALLRLAGEQVCADYRTRLRQAPRGTTQPLLTSAGLLPARWLLHVRLASYTVRQSDCHLLAAAYRDTLAAADELGARTIALPALGTTPPYWPLQDATRVCLTTLFGTRTAVREVRLVLSSPAGLELFAEALARR